MADTIYCPSCGEKNERKAKFCARCGSEFEDIPKGASESEKILSNTVKPSDQTTQESEPISVDTTKPVHTSTSQVGPYGRKTKKYPTADQVRKSNIYATQGQPSIGNQQSPNSNPQPGPRPTAKGAYPVNNGNQAPVGFSPTPQKRHVFFAKFGDRFLAFIIDSIIFSALTFVIGLISGERWLRGIGMATIYTDAWPSIIVSYVYFCLFDILNDGKSPGKAIMKLKIVDEDTLGEITTKQALLHNLGKVLFLPIDLIIGLIAGDDGDPKEKSQIRISQRMSKTVVLKQYSNH